MARKIAFLNYKGGVGKTSLTVNIAAAMAEAGKRVLLVDLDTQSNSSIWLLRLEKWNRINMSNRDMIYSVFVPGEQRISDIIVSDAVRDQHGKKLLPGLDLLPTAFSFIDLENEYVPDPHNPHFVIFRDQLKEVEGNYDYILFDCPPNFLRATQLGVFASNEMVVPSNPDALSLIGFTLMVEKLMLFHKRSSSFRTEEMGRPAYVRGIIFNAIKANVDISVAVMRMQMRLKQFIRQRFVSPDARVFNARVRDATIVRRAVSLGIPVNVVAGNDTQQGIANDFRNLASEIEEHEPSASSVPAPAPKAAPAPVHVRSAPVNSQAAAEVATGGSPAEGDEEVQFGADEPAYEPAPTPDYEIEEGGEAAEAAEELPRGEEPVVEEEEESVKEQESAAHQQEEPKEEPAPVSQESPRPQFAPKLAKGFRGFRLPRSNRSDS